MHAFVYDISRSFLIYAFICFGRIVIFLGWLLRLYSIGWDLSFSVGGLFLIGVAFFFTVGLGR